MLYPLLVLSIDYTSDKLAYADKTFPLAIGGTYNVYGRLFTSRRWLMFRNGGPEVSSHFLDYHTDYGPYSLTVAGGGWTYDSLSGIFYFASSKTNLGVHTDGSHYDFWIIIRSSGI